MKILLSRSLASSVLLILCLSLFGEEPAHHYKIIKSYADKSLQETEAVFVFSFTDKNNNKVYKDIKLTYNGTLNTADADSIGNISIKLKPGKYSFCFKYYRDDRNIMYVHNQYEITTDSILINPAFHTEITVNLGNVTDNVENGVVKKPVIYFYPEKTIPVSVRLNFKGTLKFTYPEYNSGWDFISDADGTIHLNGKNYHYLFWEGNTDKIVAQQDRNEGFIIKKNELVPFFEDKLTIMGLSSSEQEDFITFWYPLMSVNENNYVRFIFNEKCDAISSIAITPKPDNIFRVYMIWSIAEVTDKGSLKEQSIPSFKRNGFTVVEWGGALLKEDLARGSVTP